MLLEDQFVVSHVMAAPVMHDATSDMDDWRAVLVETHAHHARDTGGDELQLLRHNGGINFNGVWLLPLEFAESCSQWPQCGRVFANLLHMCIEVAGM